MSSDPVVTARRYRVRREEGAFAGLFSVIDTQDSDKVVDTATDQPYAHWAAKSLNDEDSAVNPGLAAS